MGRVPNETERLFVVRLLAATTTKTLRCLQGLTNPVTPNSPLVHPLFQSRQYQRMTTVSAERNAANQQGDAARPSPRCADSRHQVPIPDTPDAQPTRRARHANAQPDSKQQPEATT